MEHRAPGMANATREGDGGGWRRGGGGSGGARVEAGAARARVLVVLFALPRGLVYIGGHKRPWFRKPNRIPYTNPIQTPHAKLERKKE